MIKKAGQDDWFPRFFLKVSKAQPVKFEHYQKALELLTSDCRKLSHRCHSCDLSEFIYRRRSRYASIPSLRTRLPHRLIRTGVTDK